MTSESNIAPEEQEDFTQLRQLIALKRYEQPDDAYFEEFLDEFHSRQRGELLSSSSRSLFVERVATWFSGFNNWNLVYGGGLAYAAIFFAFFFWPKNHQPVQPDMPTAPVEHIKKPDMLKPSKDKQPVRETY